VGAVVNDSNAKGNFQALLELRQENNPREQSRHSHWNPDRGSWNEVSRGWESVGDDGDYGDDDYGNFGRLVSTEKNNQLSVI